MEPAAVVDVVDEARKVFDDVGKGLVGHGLRHMGCARRSDGRDRRLQTAERNIPPAPLTERHFSKGRAAPAECRGQISVVASAKIGAVHQAGLRHHSTEAPRDSFVCALALRPSYDFLTHFGFSSWPDCCGRANCKCLENCPPQDTKVVGQWRMPCDASGAWLRT
jgi:hypothetical protein